MNENNLNQENRFINVDNNQVINNNIPNQMIMPSYTEPENNKSFAFKRGFNKKIILIVLAVIIVALGVIAFFYFRGRSNSGETMNLNAIFDPEKPIVIKKENKYGYITSDGEVMIEPQYNSASDFYGDYAIVMVDKPAESTFYGEEIYQVIDRKGNVKASAESYSSPEYVSEYDIWIINGVLYNSKLKPITKEGISVIYESNGYLTYTDVINSNSGIMNYKGKTVFSWALSTISADICDSEYTDELYAIVNSYSDTEVEAVISLKTGDTLYSLENPDKYNLSSEKDGIFYLYNTDNYEDKTWLYFDDNKLVYQTTEKIDDLYFYDYDNQILQLDYGYWHENAGKSERYYYYDVEDKKLLTNKPEKSAESDKELDLMELVYGYKEFSSNGKYGLIANDKIVLPCEYESINFVGEALFNYMKEEYNQELILLERDDKTMLMDLNSQKALTTFDSTYVYDSARSTFLKASIYEDWTTTGYVIYNVISGKSMTVDVNDTYSINSNYITITKDNKKTYYNTKLEEIYVEDIGN